MSETTRKDLERTIQQARDDMTTWPEWMREAARMGAAIAPNALSVADERDRLRAENERLRRLLSHATAGNPGSATLVMLMNESDRLRAEIERLRAPIVETLHVYAAEHGRREWYSCGAYLYPGQRIVVLDHVGDATNMVSEPNVGGQRSDD